MNIPDEKDFQIIGAVAILLFVLVIIVGFGMWESLK